MIQPRTQTPTYWGSDFTLTDADIEQLYNHFLEVERPQSMQELTQVIVKHRIQEEADRVAQLMTGRKLYQPQESFTVGDQLVFPALQFAYGEVTAIRPGFNPQFGDFQVISVAIDKKTREFAAELAGDHLLNGDPSDNLQLASTDDIAGLQARYGPIIQGEVSKTLTEHEEFVRLGSEWFVKALMADVNVGHLHLAEAVLEIHEGGPLSPEDILPHLDMDESIDSSVQRFSLNYALLNDARFDEVAPKDKVAWFLQRLEPAAVKETPARLSYTPIPHDRALLSPQLLLLERELDDEWSDLEAATLPHPVVFSLLYPHRLAGTLPLSSRIRPLFPPSISPRQRAILIDEYSNQELSAWVVQKDRYIYGLREWYEQYSIPIGGFIHLKPGSEEGVVIIGYDRRRKQREWIRLASASDNRMQFELKRRDVGCGYDDLLIVGTDTIAAIDALWKRAESHQRTIASLLAELFPQLADLNPQKTVHAKTLYSAINMLRRVPPGPLFAELVRYPAFQPVGDHYWRFDSNRWREGD